MEHPQPLRNIIMTACLSITVPFMVGIGVLSFLISSSLLRSLINEQINSAARNMEFLVKNYQDDAVSHLEEVNVFLAAQSHHDRPLASYGPGLIHTLPAILSIILTDSAGKVVDVIPDDPELIGN